MKFVGFHDHTLQREALLQNTDEDTMRTEPEGDLITLDILGHTEDTRRRTLDVRSSLEWDARLVGVTRRKEGPTTTDILVHMMGGMKMQDGDPALTILGLHRLPMTGATTEEMIENTIGVTRERLEADERQPCQQQAKHPSEPDPDRLVERLPRLQVCAPHHIRLVNTVRSNTIVTP